MREPRRWQVCAGWLAFAVAVVALWLALPAPSAADRHPAAATAGPA